MRFCGFVVVVVVVRFCLFVCLFVVVICLFFPPFQLMDKSPVVLCPTNKSRM